MVPDPGAVGQERAPAALNGQYALVTTEPWWRRLEGQPPNPQWWERSAMARVGLIGTVIFGGGFLLRTGFPDRLGGFAWLWGLLAAPFVILLIAGVLRSRA